MKRLFAITLIAPLLAGCFTTSNPFTNETEVSKTAIGAGIGAGVGALAGLIISSGGTDNDKRRAVLNGLGLGAIAGGGTGAYMDSQESELRAQLEGSGVSVTRVGDGIILNMPSNITFGVGLSNIQPQFYSVLDSVALVLAKYNSSVIDVYGHTDSDGSLESNQLLSEQRALSVGNYLVARSIDGRRILVSGKGETEPVASNSTPEGKAQNRRVEIKVSPFTGQ